MKRTAGWIAILFISTMVAAQPHKAQPPKAVPVYNQVGKLVWHANVVRGAHYSTIMPNGDVHTADCTDGDCVIDASPGYWEAILADGTTVPFSPCAGNLSDELGRRTDAASRTGTYLPISFNYRIQKSEWVAALTLFYVENTKPAPAMFGQRGRESCYNGAVDLARFYERR